MRREGRSRTFCRKCEQIYRTLFVSNSRNQPVGIDPSQITAYAKKYRKCDHRKCVHMNFAKITRYLTKLRNSDLLTDDIFEISLSPSKVLTAAKRPK